MKLYVFGSERVGGVRIATLSLLNSLKAIGYEVEYVFGFKVINLYFLTFFNILRGRKNDYYFITWGIYNLFPFPRNRTLSFLHGFPSYNQQDVFRYFLFRIIILFNKLSRTKTISISKYSQSILNDIYSLKTIMIRNTIPLDYLNLTNSKDLEKDIEIIFVGRANRFKLPIYIIEYFETLANNGLKIVVIGSGESQDKYLKIHPETKIKFHSFLSHYRVIGFLKRSKYFISCSNSEPFGIVFLEALLYGCKTISPRSGGLLEIASIFPDKYKEFFYFYDNEMKVKELLFDLDYSNKLITKEKLDEILEIIKTNFNPLNHAKEIIRNLNSLRN